MRPRLIVIGLLHLGGASSLPAQQETAPFIRWQLPALSSEPTASQHSTDGTPEGIGDYRYEGLAFGGVVFGALGVLLGSRISGPCPLEPGVPCPSSKAENAFASGLVGAALGGGLGYLVGRFSPKRPPRIKVNFPAEDLVTSQQPNLPVALGLIGGGAGGVLGLLYGLSSPRYTWVPSGTQ